MTEWDEIKRLAAEFQRTQESNTLQKISERNCIDIVKKLTDLNLIELIYTCDGKEFITPSHLRKEIEDEIYYSGGRMQIHELAAKLNVDFQHVEAKANELASEKPEDYDIILGQVIHSIYKNTLLKQVSDCMLLTGQLSISDFAKTLDLPSEYLLKIINDLLPRILDDFLASPDQRTFYSSDKINRYKSIISGALTAITSPTSLIPLIKRLDMPERLFMPLVEELIKESRLDGVLDNKVFTPSIYAREQNEWIDNFYKSNSYIDYDILTRMSIKQPKTFLKKKYPKGIQLKSCFVSMDLVSQVESLVEDCIASNSWIDIGTLIPPAIEPQDIEQLIQDILKKNRQLSMACTLFDKTHVYSAGFVDTCRKSLHTFMQSIAQDHLDKGKLLDYFYNGKIPGSDSKSDTKEPELKPVVIEEPEAPKRNRSRAARRAAPSPDRNITTAKKSPLVFMTPEEMVSKLKIITRDSDECPNELLEHVARALSNGLNETYLPIAKNTIDEYIKTLEIPQEETEQKKEEFE